MKFISFPSVLLVLTGCVIAAPGTVLRQEQAHARPAGSHINRVTSSELSNATSLIPDSGGAYLSGTGFVSITGTITVPSDTSHSTTSVYVALDGQTCGTASLLLGIDLTYSGSSVSYDAWYEWYPDYAYDFSGITISAGNVITLTLTATSKTAGKATISNTSTGQTVSHTFSNEGSLGSLCEYDAEWIVESDGDFGTVTFTGCSATDSAGIVGTTGAKIIDAPDITCSIPSSSSVKCTYV